MSNLNSRTMYVVLHTHNHGVTTYLFNANRSDLGQWVSNEEEISDTAQRIISGLKIDFEPNKGEFLDITSVWDHRHEITELKF